MSTQIDRLTELAKGDPKRQFYSIAHMITFGALYAAFRGLRKKASAGVDGVTYEEYERDVAGNLQTLHERGNSDSVRPSWSNDGKWLYFGSNATGSWQVWKVPSRGGTALQVTRHGGFEAKESPDGKLVYYVKGFRVGADGPGIWKTTIGGGEETRLLNQGMSGLWTVTSGGIYFVVLSPSGASVVECFNSSTKRMTQVALLPEDTRRDTVDPAFTISPDARTILYGQAIPPGNSMIVENFR